MDPHRVNLQLHLLSPSPSFLGITFDRTLSFSKHVSVLKTKFFHRLMVLRCILISSWGPSKEPFFLLTSHFSLLTYASPGWLPFISVTKFTNLKRLQRMSSHVIICCPPLSDAFPPPLRVTLIHFARSSYVQALRLPTSFSISGLS